jgi:hypothetical protein
MGRALMRLAAALVLASLAVDAQTQVSLIEKDIGVYFERLTSSSVCAISR